MIIYMDLARCQKCDGYHDFMTGEEYSLVCPDCGGELEVFYPNLRCDTERTNEKPPYKPTEDPNSRWYIPRITCPYCQSKNTSKVGALDKMVNTAIFGFFGTKRHKQWHCNQCNSEW